jgi:trimeric autotransporter adhesin
MWLFMPAMVVCSRCFALTKRRKLAVYFLALALAASGVLQVACGNGPSSANAGGGGTGGTSAGTYSITVNGIANAAQNTTSIKLIVQ